MPTAVTSPSPRAPVQRFVALDGLRFFGALAVLTTHAGFDSGDALRGPFAGLLSRLDAGVALFFVVSGFLLFRPHAMAHLEGRSRPRPVAYLIRRAARILPVLWVAVAAAALLVPTRGATPGDYVAVAGLAHIYVGTPLLAGLTQLWSLATEGAFYIVLPVLAWALCRGSTGSAWVRRTCLVLGAATLLGPTWMAGATALGHPSARLWLPGFIGWFAVGMLMAIWHAGRSTGLVPAGPIDTLCRFPGTLWGLALTLFVIVSTQVGGPYDLSEPSAGQAAAKSAIYTVIGLAIVLPTIGLTPVGQTPRVLRAMGGRVGRRLGDISYGFFAYHVIVLALLSRVPALAPFTGGFAVRWVVALAAALILAGVSYSLMERPLMRRVRGLPSPTAHVRTTETINQTAP